MNIELSIVIPAYNVEKFLAKCIDSILLQNKDSYEIILVDDGSKDRTLEMCDLYEQLYPNIHVYHKQNGGLSDARNFGIERAQGEYIVLIDSDDYIHPQYCERLLSIARENDSDIVVCGFSKVFEKDEVMHNDRRGEIQNYSSREAIEQLFFSDRMMNYAWNKLYKTSLFEGIRYPLGKRWEDIGTTYKLFRNARIISYTPDRLYYYVQREGSITSSNELKNVLDQYDLCSLRFEDLKDDFPALIDVMQTQLCVIGYNCWSFLQTTQEKINSNDLKKAQQCVNFLDKCGKEQLKHWVRFEEYRRRIQLYFLCKPILSLIIKVKRRKQ